MLTIFLLMLGGALAGGGITAFTFGTMLRRRQRAQLELLQLHITRQVALQVSRAAGPVFTTAGKLTEIVAQIQDGQGKQHEQLHKLAEFSLQLKKDMALVAARQVAIYEAEGEDEGEFASDAGDRPRYLN